MRGMRWSRESKKVLMRQRGIVQIGHEPKGKLARWADSILAREAAKRKRRAIRWAKRKRRHAQRGK